MAPADWTRRGLPPDIDVALESVAVPTAAFYRELYDRVGRPWLWYERRLLSDAALSTLLAQPGHELHVARHDGDLVGYFELAGDELVFFGLTLAYVGRRIGPWLLDRAVERAFARGTMRLVLGDLVATFTNHGTPVAKAAINAKVDLKIAAAPGGGNRGGVQSDTIS